MELILKQDVANLGFKDDVVTVKNGYGRNFLIPQGFAHLATSSAKKVLAENLKQRAHKEAKVVADAQALANALKAIEINPQLFDPYVALGGFYAQTKRYDEALEKLEQAKNVNEKNLGVHMLIGMIHEMRKDVPQAQAAYEKVLEINPRFGPAANNLAYLYSEKFDQLDKAYDAARKALLAIFEILGFDAQLTRAYQRKLENVLF